MKRNAIIELPWTNPFATSATAEDIYYCFRNPFFGRNPQPHEWPGHISRVGEELREVTRTYLNSKEFLGRKLLNEWLPDDVELAQLDGFSIYTSLNDNAIGKYVRKNSYEPHVVAVFLQFLKPGMAVIDVGANIGFFSLLSAKLVGPTGYVLGVEPNPQNVAFLEASRRRNGFDHVTIVQAAARVIESGFFRLTLPIPTEQHQDLMETWLSS